eukprot:1053173-Amorphochlora_amoeboformis.AAC.1
MIRRRRPGAGGSRSFLLRVQFLWGSPQFYTSWRLMLSLAGKTYWVRIIAARAGYLLGPFMHCGSSSCSSRGTRFLQFLALPFYFWSFPPLLSYIVYFLPPLAHTRFFRQLLAPGIWNGTNGTNGESKAAGGNFWVWSVMSTIAVFVFSILNYVDDLQNSRSLLALAGLFSAARVRFLSP